MKALHRENPIADAKRAPTGKTLDSTKNSRRTPTPLDKIWHANANTPSVASTNGHWPKDPIHCMVSTMLAENWDMKPEDSIVVKVKLNIPSPEEYSGSSDLKVYVLRPSSQEYCDG